MRVLRSRLRCADAFPTKHRQPTSIAGSSASKYPTKTANLHNAPTVLPTNWQNKHSPSNAWQQGGFANKAMFGQNLRRRQHWLPTCRAHCDVWRSHRPKRHRRNAVLRHRRLPSACLVQKHDHRQQWRKTAKLVVCAKSAQINTQNFKITSHKSCNCCCKKRTKSV